jgi:CubicO group peptidase (beta-lactamase class C family)
MLRRAVFAMVALVTTAGAQNLPPSDSAARWVDSIFSNFTAPGSPGCAVGVSRNGVLTLAKGYGLADLEHDSPITADTRFYIASLSKQFTAMAVVLLAQDGRLSLDDSIRKWVPEVPSFGAPITLRELLHHTSGLRDYFTLLAVSGWPSDGPLTEKQFLALVGRQRSLNFSPGDEFLYSNTGYALLSIVVKRASGLSLREFAAQRIFGPLGMTHTEFRDDHTELIPQRAVGYRPTGSGFRISQPELDVVGDGGAYSTINDLAKWDQNFRTGRVGGKKAIALIEEPGTLNNGQVVPYGLAVTFGSVRGVKTLGHSGEYAGYRSALLRFADRGVSVITLCNTSGASPTLAEQVGTVVLGLASRQTAVTTLDLSTSELTQGAATTSFDSTGTRRRNDQLAQLAGSYYSDELDLLVDLVVRDGTLVLERPGADDLRFVAFANDVYTNADKMLLRVVRDDHEAVTGFTLTISRVRDLEFVRREADRGSRVH